MRAARSECLPGGSVFVAPRRKIGRRSGKSSLCEMSTGTHLTPMGTSFNDTKLNSSDHQAPTLRALKMLAHLRGVASDEGDRRDMDESRQVDELPVMVRHFAGNPLPVKARAQLVIQGQHCPDNAQRLVRTEAPTVHGTVVSVFLQIVSSMGWCRSLRGVDVSCAFLRGKPHLRGVLCSLRTK